MGWLDWLRRMAPEWRRIDPARWVAGVERIWHTYLSALGRDPDAAGLANHLYHWIDRGGTDDILDAICLAIEASPEAEARRRAPTPAPPTRLWLRGRVFADATGSERLVVGTTLFWLPWGVRHDVERATRHLRWIAREGVDAVRVLASVGPETWEDRTIDPAWDDYEVIIEDTLRLASACGLRVIWTLFGGGRVTDDPVMRRRVIEAVVRATTRHPHAVLYLEAINEGWNQRGWTLDDAKAVANELADRLPEHPVAVTAVEPGPPPSVWYAGARASLTTWHFERWTGGEGGRWRPVRQPWEAQYRDDLPRPFVNQEPIGPGSSVESDHDPVRLAMGAVVTWIAGGCVHVVHSGAGIRGREDLHPTAGRRPANLWEEPALPPTFALIRALRAALPAWLPRGTRVNVGPGRDHPLSVSQLLPAIGRGDLLRAYATEADGGFVVAALAVRDVIPGVEVRRQVSAIETIVITPDGQLERSMGSWASAVTLRPAATIVIGRP